MSMANLPESQRRAIVRTAVMLGLVAFAIFVYTLMRGWK